MTAYAIHTFPWPSPPLTMNQRLHWAAKAKLTAMVREAAALKLRGFPPVHRVEVTLTWVVRTKHRRDAENPIPTLKALCDGIVDAGVVLDDVPELMTKHMPVIRYDPTVEAHMILEVEEIP